MISVLARFLMPGRWLRWGRPATGRERGLRLLFSLFHRRIAQARPSGSLPASRCPVTSSDFRSMVTT